MAVSVRKKKLFVLASKPSVRMCWERDIINMTSVEVSWPVPMRAIGAQNLLTMPGGVCHSGYVHKKGGSQFSLMKWPLRYLIIHKGCVYYFKSSTSPAPQGAFSLNGYNRVMRAAEETTSSNVFPFKIVHFSKKHRTWYFSAASEDERRKWMRNLRKEIDHYNDRRDSHVSSDSESDADSFYGSIECPMDITHAPDDPEGNYMLEDEEDDEDDYEKPDSPATSTGRPTVPPPSYPPPPVPCQFRMESMSGFCKGLPPPVPAPNRSTTSPLPKKPPAPLPPPKLGEVSHNQHGHKDIPNKGPPRPPPTHLKPSSERSAWSPKSPIHPPPPMASLKMQAMMGQISISTIPGGKHKDRMPPVPVTLQSPATLSICSDLERKMVLHSSPSPPGCRGNNPSHIPSMPNHCLSSRPAPDLPPQALPALNHTKPGLYKPPLVPKLPCPAVKPKLPRGSAQSSPDGQSFRTTVDEVPASFRKSRDPSKDTDDDSDEDYENMQLPDSVFMDTTETTNIEKLFKESSRTPQDGLYCFRNSGTKTSKVLVVWDVSVCKARNYRLFEEDSRVFLELEMTFPSLSALVEHYHSHPLPNHGSLCLQKPYGYIVPR
ncbi:SH3 domain-binding protein 2 isoform X2 [Coregonus clupeaformis]|uniref:SH3 domain-binding protein 2 isoform X2 n=1 Tax=Coregonus clupeaformis TaxID=59861 RepID=UPI001BDFC9E8|nr:SH3 domain-binding protein 2 isoform X2 [Coregonus clupeaformis]